MRVVIVVALTLLLGVACGGGGSQQIYGTPSVTGGTQRAPSASANDYGY